MATAGIILPYSVDAFNQVNDYFHVRKYGDRDKKYYDMLGTVNAFGDLYCQHDMETTAGLSISHRHFDLKQGEKKIATQVNDKLLRIKATPVHSIPEGAKVLPYLFQPTKDEAGNIRLIPLEFVIHEDPKHIQALEHEIEAICKPSFLQDFWELSEAHRVDGLYGIFLMSRHFLRYTHKEGTVEDEATGDRTLKVTVVPKAEILKKEDSTTVGWGFRKDGATGRVVPVSACSALGHGGPDADDAINCGVCPHCHHPTCYPACAGVNENLPVREYGF